MEVVENCLDVEICQFLRRGSIASFENIGKVRCMWLDFRNFRQLIPSYFVSPRGENTSTVVNSLVATSPSPSKVLWIIVLGDIRSTSEHSLNQLI